MKVETNSDKSLTALPLQRRGIYPQAPWIFLLFAPLLLRILPINNAFWFDEIWSWQIAQVVKSPLEILTNPLAQTDNNHPLNTLWMYLIGDAHLSWWIYRLPALLAGCAMCVLIFWKERKSSPTAALITCLLIGLSFPLITYSTEARGYAPMLLCAVGAYYILRATSTLALITFSILCSLALLFHLTFIHFLLAAIVFAVTKKLRKKLIIFLLPIATLVAYYFIFLRHIHVGGAPDSSGLFTAAQTLCLILGGPMETVAVYPIAIIVFALIVLAIRRVWHQSRSEALFFVTAIFIAPAASIVLQSALSNQAPSMQVRYLLIPITFSLILLSRYLAAILQQRSPIRYLAMAVLALATLGNGYHLGLFLSIGRGDYRGAIEHIGSETTGSEIMWSSSDAGNTFRNSTLILYYQRFFPRKAVFRVSNDPAWLIFNVEDQFPPFPPTVNFNNHIYQFDSFYPAYGLSGWSWVLYSKK